MARRTRRPPTPSDEEVTDNSDFTPDLPSSMDDEEDSDAYNDIVPASVEGRNISDGDYDYSDMSGADDFDAGSYHSSFNGEGDAHHDDDDESWDEGEEDEEAYDEESSSDGDEYSEDDDFSGDTEDEDEMDSEMASEEGSISFDSDEEGDYLEDIARRHLPQETVSLTRNLVIEIEMKEQELERSNNAVESHKEKIKQKEDAMKELEEEEEQGELPQPHLGEEEQPRPIAERKAELAHEIATLKHELEEKTLRWKIIRRNTIILWRDLALSLRDVHKTTSEKYAKTLDYRDRQPVEHLARLIYSEALESICTLRLQVGSPDDQLYKITTYVSFLICEAKRDGSIAEQFTTQDLCPMIVNESVRSRRLVPMSMLYAILEGDNGAMPDVIANGTHKAVFQRLKHVLPTEAANAVDAARRAFGVASPIRAAAPSPLLPPSNILAEEEKAVTPSLLETARKRQREGFSWKPKVGDRVVTGPDWMEVGNEIRGTELVGEWGTVVGVSEGHVLVQWPSSSNYIDSDGTANINRNARLSKAFRSDTVCMRYSYDNPCQVVPLDVALEEDVLAALPLDFKREELLLTTALIGSMALAKEVVLPAIQYGIVQGMIRLCRSGVFEFCSRALWALSCLLIHRRLAQVFVQSDGVSEVLQLAEKCASVSHRYGCGLVFSQLAKPNVFELILTSATQVTTRAIVNISRENLNSDNSEVRGAGCAFFYGACGFPRVLHQFDSTEGANAIVDILVAILAKTKEAHDIVDPALTLAASKTLQVWTHAHLMLASRVLFRKHRQLSALLDQPPERSLPRDSKLWDRLLALLGCPLVNISDGLSDSPDAAWSSLTPERIPMFRSAMEKGAHLLLLESVTVFLRHIRFDLLVPAMNLLVTLAYPPFCRRYFLEAQVGGGGEDTQVQRGIQVLLSVVDAYDKTKVDSLVSVGYALHTLMLLLDTPTNMTEEDRVSFDKACNLVRVNDGVRILLGFLRRVLPDNRNETSNPNAPRSRETDCMVTFPAASLAVKVMSQLAAYSDTQYMFADNSVKCALHAIANHYKPATQGLADENKESQEGLDRKEPSMALQKFPAPWQRYFMENISTLLGGSAGARSIKSVIQDPFEAMERQAIVSRSHLEYQRDSLLSLIAQHLDQEGLGDSASLLRQEAKLHPGAGAAPKTASPTTRHTPGLPNNNATSSAFTLDDIIRSYLKQQHDDCPAPIAAVPPFDLNRQHQYNPAPAEILADPYKNLYDRFRKRSVSYRFDTEFQRQSHVGNNSYAHSKNRIVFDIRGGSDGIAANCVCFIDNGDLLAVGTSEGGIALFDTKGDMFLNNNEKLVAQHILLEDEQVSALVCSANQQFIAATSHKANANIIKRGSLPAVAFTLENSGHVDFARDGQHLLATDFKNHSHVKYIDMETQNVVKTFIDNEKEKEDKENHRNVGTFDCSGNLVLSDAMLFDVRLNNTNPIFRFDRISNLFRSTFHPSGMMAIIDDNIWDLRMRQMLLSCPYLSNSVVKFTDHGNMLYSWGLTESLGSLNMSGNQLNILDAGSFQLVKSMPLRQNITSFDVDPIGRHFAGLFETDSDASVRVYGIGVDPSARSTRMGDDDDNDDDDDLDDDAESIDSDDFDDGSTLASSPHLGDDDDEDDEWFEEGDEDDDVFSSAAATESDA